MKQVIMVTFPRSGHHALVGFLDKVSGFGDQYCEYYNCARHDHSEIRCVKKNIPWTEKNLKCGANKSVLKNHDFDLNLAIDPAKRYIVQFRHPFLSIESWFDRRAPRIKERGGVPDEWPLFFQDKLMFWVGFAKKWLVESSGLENVMLVPYDSMADWKKIIEILEFSGHTAFVPDKFESPFLQSNRRLVRFEPEIYKKKERQLAPLLETAGLKKLFT